MLGFLVERFGPSEVVALVIHELGLLAAHRGNLQEAHDLFERAVNLFIQLEFDADHPPLLSAMASMACMLDAVRRLSHGA